MGTILQERVPQQCLERVSIRDRDWKKKASWCNSRPYVDSNKMGRRQSQRKPLQPQYMLPSHENNNEKWFMSCSFSDLFGLLRGLLLFLLGSLIQLFAAGVSLAEQTGWVSTGQAANGLPCRWSTKEPRDTAAETAEERLQQRRKHKPNTPSTKRNTSLHSAQGASESKSHQLSPAENRMDPKVQAASHRKEHKHTGFRGTRHTPAFPCHRLTESSPDLLERLPTNPETGCLSGHGHGDSDTDLSESEILQVSPSRQVPPKLELRPELIEAEDCSTRSYRPRGRNHGGFDFPDFLPPPFNSWSLTQLAVFYNMEGRGSPRPRPVGPLERYLERLLQLEWRQIQTSQEESGKSAVSDVVSSCHRSPAAASSRLSSPKCILQCQRAFPLTFLSSLASHSALLSGCACTLCRIRYSTNTSSCCRSTHSHTRQSRLSPTLERRGPTSLPKRSYSESRVPSSDRCSTSQRFGSPVRTSSHLRRMQASGNLRNPVQGANTKTHSTARDSSVGRECLRVWGDVLDYRTGGVRRRSGSEQRRGGADRHQGTSEKRRSGSECRRGGGAERKTTAELKEWEIKPDAVTAIMDNLPGSKNSPTNRPNRNKQVEFVT